MRHTVIDLSCRLRGLTHSCYKGQNPIPGCTVFHHPLNSAESHHCKLCLDCLKSCPKDSARLYVRPPLVGVWKLGSASGALAPFAVSLWILSLVFLAAETGVCFTVSADGSSKTISPSKVISQRISLSVRG